MSSGVGGSNGPRGTESPIAESGITEIRDARLTNMAVRRGWLGNRWPTRETVAEFQARVSTKGATLIDRAVLTTNKLMMSEDPRAMGIAVRCAITMEAQNQADDHRDDRDGSQVGSVVGCSFTPDQIATAMDATIPDAPEEEKVTDGTDATADASLDPFAVPPTTIEAVADEGTVPSGGSGPTIRQD